MTRTGAFFRLLKIFAREACGLLFIRLPRLLLLPIVPFLFAAVCLWELEPHADPAFAFTAATVLFTCYGLAGLCWGTRRTICQLGNWLIGVIEDQSPRIVDALTGRLASLAPMAERQVELASLRADLQVTASHLVFAEGDARLVARAANWAARRQLKTRTVVLDRFLSDLEQRGETHISAASLQRYVRDHLIGLAVADFRGKVALANACGHVLTLLFAAGPLLAHLLWSHLS